jgi:hypothetical protein
MSVEQLPFEVQEFDRLLTKPNSDPTGLAGEFSRRVGVMPDVFEVTSSGAMEFGARRYTFASNGWRGTQS